MSRSGHPDLHATVRGIRLISTAAGKHGTRPGFRLPLCGALVFAGIRVLSLATAAFLLPRGKFHELHYSLQQLIVSWDSGYYLGIAVHGYPHEPGNIRYETIFAWFPGYPAAIHAIAWLPGVSPVAGRPGRDDRRRAGSGMGPDQAGHDADRRPAGQPAHDRALGGGARLDRVVHGVFRSPVLRPGHLVPHRPGGAALADGRGPDDPGRDRAQQRPGPGRGGHGRGAARPDPGRAGAAADSPRGGARRLRCCWPRSACSATGGTWPGRCTGPADGSGSRKTCTTASTGDTA